MKTYLLSAALAGTLLFAGQATATDLLQDDDLDRMTAAGDPVVIISEGAAGSTVAYNEDTEFQLNIPKDAQVGLRALTIQNVVGELQLLVNLNVLSAQNSVAGTDQRNFSLQSWGSTLPDADTVKTATASASAGAACSVPGSCAATGGTATGGAASPGGNAAAAAQAAAGGAGGAGGTGGAGGPGAANLGLGGSNPACTTNCTGGSADGPGGTGGAGGSANGGNGGNAAAAAAAGDGGHGGAAGSATANAAGNSGIIKGNGAASTSAVVSDKLGSASGDVIILSKSASGTSQVAFDNAGKYGLSFESMAQRDLSALFISNVVGRAQMALNLNIAAATLNLIPGSGDSFASPISDTSAVIKQVNTGIQFRGTPLVGASGTTGTFNTSITHLNQ